MMHIEIAYGDYPANEWSRPWIARARLNPRTRNMALDFGHTVSTRNGDPGWLQVEAPIGGIILVGQTSHRSDVPSKRTYYTIHTDGSLCPVSYDQAWDIIRKEHANAIHALPH